MGFCVEALQHNAGEVREAAERIIKQLYLDVGAPVKQYLPHDDDKTRKVTLWRQLFEYFDRIDGKPTKQDLQVGVHWQDIQVGAYTDRILTG